MQDFEEIDEQGKGSNSITPSRLSYEQPPQLAIGGTTNTILITSKDPLTGESKKMEVIVKHRDSRNGETVYRELGKLQT